MSQGHLLQNCVWVKASQYQPVVRISRLPPAQKQTLWAGIKRHNPALANMLATDPIIKQLKDTFQAEVVMTETEINYLAQ